MLFDLLPGGRGMNGLVPLFDFFERIYTIWKGNAWNKAAYLLVLAGVASITSIFQYVIVAAFAVTGVRLVIPETPLWVSFPLIAIGLGFFVLGRFLPDIVAKRAANSKDVALYRQFKKHITANALAFMREHNFRIPFNRDYLSPFQTIAYGWRGGRFTFVDPIVQKMLEPVVASAMKLDQMIDHYTYPCDGNAAWSTPLTREDEHGGITPATLGRIKEMNEAASDLVGKIDDFEKTADARIPA
jgi:hypothetical protein